MRRAMLAGLAAVGLCGPAAAFDFTPRSFGAVFDEDFRNGNLRYEDRCAEPGRTGYNCSYGVMDKGPTAFVSNLYAERDQANAVGLWWTKSFPLTSHLDQLAAIVKVCSPEMDGAKRQSVVDLLIRQGRSQTSLVTLKGVQVEGVRYALLIENDGSAHVQVLDLRMPAMADVADLFGDTVDLK